MVSFALDMIFDDLVAYFCGVQTIHVWQFFRCRDACNLTGMEVSIRFLLFFFLFLLLFFLFFIFFFFFFFFFFSVRRRFSSFLVLFVYYMPVTLITAAVCGEAAADHACVSIRS